MAPNRREVVASSHLVCGNCSSWIQFESSGCGKTWAETRRESFAFTCKGCAEVTALVKEVEGLRQMVEDMTDCDLKTKEQKHRVQSDEDRREPG